MIILFWVPGQNLNIAISYNNGFDFFGIKPQDISSDPVSFNGPFELMPSNPDFLFAGTNFLYKVDLQALDWQKTSLLSIDDDNSILSIALSETNPDLIYVSIVPLNAPPAKVFRSTDQGKKWIQMQGLPDRVAMDIAIHPEDPGIAFIAYGGFGTAHLYKTNDGGESWFPKDAGLPDIPTNTILFDPLWPDYIYAGKRFRCLFFTRRR